jgi:ABC-type glycerol-3-phosphate transport system permease component
VSTRYFFYRNKNVMLARAGVVALKTLTIVLGTLFAAILLSVLVWTVSTSFKPTNEVLAYPPTLWPRTLTLVHYQEVLDGPFFRWALNSLIVSVGTVLLVLFVSAPAAYGATRYKFPGQTIILFAILLGMAVGQAATVLPFYLLGAETGSLDSHELLIFAFAAWMTPLGTWMLRGYFLSLPKELDEAAMLDGLSRLGILIRIILPISWPALSAVSIITFVYAWNEFLLAAALTSTDAGRTLPVGLDQYRGYLGVDYGNLSAGVTVSMLPVVVLFLALQRRFIAGLSGGALGGT